MGRANNRNMAHGAVPRRGAEAAAEKLTVIGSEHRAWRVTPGVIDADAVHAFTSGQCHALALALHERTGWPLRWLEDDEGDPLHCFVETPEGKALDIAGVHDRDEMLEGWQGVYDEAASSDQLRALSFGFGGWRVPDTKAASAFVDAVLALHAEGTELHPAGVEELPYASSVTTDRYIVACSNGEVREFAAGDLDAMREHMQLEQSHSLAFYLCKPLEELTGLTWRTGVTEDDEGWLHAYAVNTEHDVAVDAFGVRDFAELEGLDLMRPREMFERFEEAEYVATDHGLGKHAAELLLTVLDLSGLPSAN